MPLPEQTVFRAMSWTGGADGRPIPCATCMAMVAGGSRCVIEVACGDEDSVFNWDVLRVFCVQCGIDAAAGVGKTPHVRSHTKENAIFRTGSPYRG